MRLNMMDCVSRLSVVLITVILPVTRWVFFLSNEIGTKLTTGCVRSNAIRRSIVIPSIRSCTSSSRQANGLLIRIQLHVRHVGSGMRMLEPQGRQERKRSRRRKCKRTTRTVYIIYCIRRHAPLHRNSTMTDYRPTSKVSKSRSGIWRETFPAEVPAYNAHRCSSRPVLVWVHGI